MSKNLYRLRQVGELMSLKAVFGSNDGMKSVRLLVDTGSSYTVLPTDLLQELGCDLQKPISRMALVTAGGTVYAPIVAVPWFSCLGQRYENFPVVVKDVPFGTFTSGLLGMDFLRKCDAIIYTKRAEILVQFGDE